MNKKTNKQMNKQTNKLTNKQMNKNKTGKCNSMTDTTNNLDIIIHDYIQGASRIRSVHSTQQNGKAMPTAVA